MKRLRMFFLGIITLVSALSYGQGKVSGYLKDYLGDPMNRIIVSLQSVKDTTQISKVFTDNKGFYAFDNLKSGNYRLLVSVIGSKPVNKQLMLFKDTKLQVDIKLEEDMYYLPEVDVKGHSGFIVKGDTTTYFAGSYVSGQEKNLKDLLEKLPGMRIDASSNSITANGKPIRKILLENQDLFQGNTSVPLENLSSDGIDKVEVIENYTEYNIWEGFKSTNETVINLNMNDKMKGRIKGQSDIQGGVKEKYFVRSTGLLIGKKGMLSAILSGNNTGDQLLKVTDLIKMNGSYSELIASGNVDEEMKKMVNTYAPFLDGRKNVYKRDNGLLSLNAVLFPSSKIKVSWNGIVGLDRYKLGSNDHYEYLTSDLVYDNLRNERQFKQHILSNLKINYTPRKDFNLFYTGNFSYGKKNQDLANVILNNPINVSDDNNVLISNNNLLMVKSFGRKSINLSLDFDYNSMDENYRFKSDSIFYNELFELKDKYKYETNHINKRFSAELFFLQRLGHSYYYRVGGQTLYNEDRLNPNMVPKADRELFDNYNYINVATQNLNLRLGKDLGNLLFTVGLNFKVMHANENLKRELSQNTKYALTPSLKALYRFALNHTLDMDYSHSYNPHAITDMVDGYRLVSYDYLVRSSVDKFFSNSHKLSLRQVSFFPFSGIILMNMLSLAYDKDQVTNDYNMRYIVNDVDKRLYSGAKQFMLMSYLDKKFFFMPLSTKLSIAYAHAYAPFYNQSKLYKSKNNNCTIMGEALTQYKRGFNGKLSVNYVWGRYKSELGNNKFTNINYKFSLSYTLPKFYASCGVRYNDDHMEDNKTHNVFFDCEARYNISKRITLQLVGEDVFHTTSPRILSESRVDNYYSLYRTVKYMPGSIRIGAIFKY